MKMNGVQVAYMAPFAFVLAVTLFRLILPYGVEETRQLEPEVFNPNERDDQDHLQTIFRFNLFDRERRPLDLVEPGEELTERFHDCADNLFREVALQCLLLQSSWWLFHEEH